MTGWHEGPQEWRGRSGRGHRGPDWASAFGAGWAGTRPGPPPWVTDLVKSFGGPDLQGGPRGARVRRGDVRSAILDVLAHGGGINGYQVIQRIHERSNGVWKPSPGSVYPTIQQLEDEGLVAGVDKDGRRLLDLTDAGREFVGEHAEEIAAMWQGVDASDTEQPGAPGAAELMPVVGQMMGGVWQVMVSGTDQQRAEAVEILGDARRRLYGLLADGDPA